MAEQAPLGQVAFDIDGERTASLFADRTWSIEPAFDATRQIIFLAILKDISDGYSGPASGFFGPSQLARAAKLFKGRVTKPVVLPDDPPGTVY